MTSSRDDADDGHGNHLGTVYVLKFDGSGTYHDFVSVESYEALKAIVVSETAALRRPPPSSEAVARLEQRNTDDYYGQMARERGDAYALMVACDEIDKLRAEQGIGNASPQPISKETK